MQKTNLLHFEVIQDLLRERNMAKVARETGLKKDHIYRFMSADSGTFVRLSLYVTLNDYVTAKLQTELSKTGAQNGH